MDLNYTPWSTAKDYMASGIGWLSDLDNQRIQSYSLYEQLYWNVPDAFTITLVGSDQVPPIQVPSAKVIIEGVNRFLGKGFDYFVDPVVGTPDDQLQVKILLAGLFKREQVYSKYLTQKRFGLIRGDSVWHVVANPLKPERMRISLYEVDPAAYFPIYDVDNPDKLLGVHLVEPFEDLIDKKVYTRRQTYRKDPETNTITTETALYEQDKWDDRTEADAKEMKLVRVIVPLTPLDPRITALPVYHIKNFRTPQGDFGSSELRGLERIAAAVNQSITDEELALALTGLGVYWTTSGPPQDEDGNEIDWVIGPGRVVETADGTQFNRVQGINTVTPSQDHVRFLLAEMRRSAGLSDTAIGRVDVQVAESGVALALELAPVLEMNAEKEAEMLSVYDHMLFDLVHMWFPVYEGTTVDVNVAAVVGDPMPANRKQTIAELLQLVTGGLITREYARQKLQAMGYDDLPDTVDADVIAETVAMNQAMGTDPFAERIRAELEEQTT